MGTVLSIFDSTSANVVSDIKTKILLSSDWSNPTGSAVTATTTLGATMYVDLADAAATTKQMQMGVYRTSAPADKITRYLSYRLVTTGANTDPLHCIVSAGKDHLFIAVEGPRAGETSPDSTTYGSPRQCLFLGQLTPYFVADTTVCVVCVGQTASAGTNDPTAHVSRNQANNSSWVPARLMSLQFPQASNSGGQASQINAVQRVASDGNTYVWPYVVVEDTAGLRGRLTKCFFAGFNFDGAYSGVSDPLPSQYSELTYGGDTYMLLASTKNNNNAVNWNAFGACGNISSSDGNTASPVIAIPVA